MDEDSRQIFDDALQNGWVETQTTKVLITGIAGSGKTSSMHVLFEEDQPEVRQSTPLTRKPIRATRVDKKSSKWIGVGTKMMLKLLAIAMRYFFALIRPKEMRTNHEREAVSSPTSSPTPQHDPIPESQENPTLDMEVLPTTQPDASYSADSTTQPDSSYSADSSGAPESSSQTEDELLDLLEKIPQGEMVAQMDFVQFIDSGGQPEFLEIMPALLTGDLFCIFVIKLCEKLDECPMVEFYNESGELVGKPYRAALTNEEFLKQGITTMLSRESQSGKGDRQRILIIGTHKDREGDCLEETREDKNEKLREVLLPYTDNVIYYGSDLKCLIFPLNARSPSEEDHTVAEKIRNFIAQCSPEPVRIPIRWYCLELRIKELAENKERSVLRKDECFSVARRLHFDEKSFVAALEFLHKLSSISYFRQFLKGVVFSDPQVLVDIVSEIVEALHKLTQESSSEGQEVFEGDWRKMRDYGIVTIKRLKSFKQHRVPDLFTYKEVTELFKALLILAVFDESSYFMPCLLKRLHTTEVTKLRERASSNVAPLLIHFPRGPRCGVFCSLVVFLLSSDNQFPGPWELYKTAEDDAPRCLYRNCIEFVVPDYPATITLIDSFSSFEVHVLIPPELCKNFCFELCPLVRDALLDGIEKARQTLHYSNWEAKLAFFCPCNMGDPHRAVPATKQDRWICSNNQLVCDRLEDKHRLWLPLEPVPRPNLEGGTYSQCKLLVFAGFLSQLGI